MKIYILTYNYNDEEYFKVGTYDNFRIKTYIDDIFTTANDLYKKAHNNNEILNKDNVIDSFMKGASTDHSRLLNLNVYLNEQYKILENETKFLREQNNKLMELIIELTNNDKNK